jgi:hypothetical protein
MLVGKIDELDRSNAHILAYLQSGVIWVDFDDPGIEYRG